MIYGILVLIGLLCVVGSVLTFTDRLREAWFYLPALAILSASNGLLYAWGCRLMPDKQAIVVLGLVTDVLMVIAYYVLPMAVFGVRVNPCIIAGGITIVAGAVFLKLGAS